MNSTAISNLQTSILLMTTGGPDPGLAADVSLGQPVTQLLLLFFVTLLIFLFHFSLLEFSCVLMCLKQLLSAPWLP